MVRVSLHHFEQCHMVVFIPDDLRFLGPGIANLVTELCLPQDTAYMLRKVIEKKAWRVPTEHLSRRAESWARKTPRSVRSKSVTWQSLTIADNHCTSHGGVESPHSVPPPSQKVPDKSFRDRKVFRRTSAILENSSLTFQDRMMLFRPRFAHSGTDHAALMDYAISSPRIFWVKSSWNVYAK